MIFLVHYADDNTLALLGTQEWLSNNYINKNSAKNHPVMLAKQKMIAKFCENTSQILNAFARIDLYLVVKIRKTIMEAFVTSYFGYCPLVWMLYIRGLNSKISSLHERALRIKYGDSNPPLQSLLEKDSSLSVHQRNLQLLATENF